MKPVFEVREQIAASPAEVWATLTDWSACPLWMEGVDSVEGPETPVIGEELRFTARGAERASELVECEPERVLGLRTTHGKVTAHYTYLIEPRGEGSALTVIARCSVSGLFMLAAPLLRIAIKSADAGQATALKNLIERRR